RGELGERAVVLRPHGRVLLERRDRLVVLTLLLEGRGEVAVRLRAVRVLRDLLLRIRDRHSRRAAAEGVDAVEEILEAVGARPDGEEREREGEDDCEERECPLRLTADAGEEEVLLGGAQLATAGALAGLARSRLRALAAFRCSSCHSVPPLSY